MNNMSTENNSDLLFNNSVKILTDLIGFKTISGEDKTKKYALKQLKKYRVLTDMIVDLGIPVKFFNVAGNHDRLLSLNFLLSVNQRYRNVEHVETITNKELRHYITYGTNLLTFTHGDELPMTGLRRNYTLQKFLIHEAKYQLQSNSMLFDNFYFFSGHLHKAKTEDAEGVYDIIVPSLAKPDYWHCFWDGNTKLANLFLSLWGVSSLLYLVLAPQWANSCNANVAHTTHHRGWLSSRKKTGFLALCLWFTLDSALLSYSYCLSITRLANH